MGSIKLRATGDPLSYNIPGTYTITWTYNDGNGNTSTQTQTIIVDECLGISNAGENISVDIYPNPSRGIFNLELSSLPEGNVQIKMVDALGQVLYSNNITSQHMYFDFSYLRAATYYIQVISDQGILTRPVIITHGY